jgi:hypothetical protein
MIQPVGYVSKAVRFLKCSEVMKNKLTGRLFLPGILKEYCCKTTFGGVASL